MTWLWVPSMGIALIVLPLVFPTGHLVSSRWRPAGWLAAGAILGLTIGVAFQPGPNQQAAYLDNPLGFAGLDKGVIGACGTLFVVAIATSLSSMVLRFRHAEGEARQQMKWFALAVLGAGTAFAAYAVTSIAGVAAPATKGLEVFVILSLMTLPIAAGIAILRYRLYDIDRIVSRTISYGIVTALLVATYVLVTLGLQAMLSGVYANNSGAVAATTLLVAALFAPLRRRVQRTVDGRFDRARYDAERTTIALSEQLRDEVDLDTLVRDLNGTVVHVIAPTTIGVWLRHPGG